LKGRTPLRPCALKPTIRKSCERKATANRYGRRQLMPFTQRNEQNAFLCDPSLFCVASVNTVNPKSLSFLCRDIMARRTGYDGFELQRSPRLRIQCIRTMSNPNTRL
jgi:hypothetical protein